jgi:steroid delta-isomerase
MPTPAEMTETVLRYTGAHTAGDVDAIAALFAEDAVLADPVDAPEHHGRDAVHDFFAATHATLDSMELRATGPVRAVGSWAAVPLQARSHIGGSVYEVDIIDVFTFGDDGLITDMRAYWTAADIRVVEA